MLSEKKIEIAGSPKYEDLPCINVLCPQTTSNVQSIEIAGLKKIEDEVRFSTDSDFSKLVKNRSRPNFRQAPKVLKFTIKGDEEEVQEKQHYSILAKENGVS